MTRLVVVLCVCCSFSFLWAQTLAWESYDPVTPWQSDTPTQVAQWDILEITLDGPRRGNPFQDVQLEAKFIQDSDTLDILGFYDTGDTYKIRFMPPQQGEWTFATTSNEQRLNGVSGSFLCTEPRPNVHGPVRVRHTYSFGYADGTPFFPLSTTAFAWVHQPEDKQRQTLETLSQASFNRVRMTVFPKDYLYVTNEPQRYPFPRNRRGENDYSRFNSEFFRHLEDRIIDLMNLGIQADLILFHPYDRWGYAEMPKTVDDFYLRYVLARLSAFRNVWWSVASEYDAVDAKTVDDWDRFFEIIYEHDPYEHLRSINNRSRMYDNNKPWITHCSVQGVSLTEMHELRQQFGKPILFEEYEYEGNLIQSWGRFSAEEIVRRFWKAATGGCFVTHGETIKDPQHEWIWWAKGGDLLGESPERLAFLKQVVQNAPRQNWQVFDQNSGGVVGDYYLYYFGEKTPDSFTFELPGYRHYQVDIIDTWNMRVESPPERFQEVFTLELPNAPYIAVRIRKSGLVFPAGPVEIVYNGNLFLRQAVVQLQHPQHETIHYTLDGTPPTEESPRYTEPIIVREDSTLLKTVSFDQDGTRSKMNSRLFLKSTPAPGAVLGETQKGIRYDYYLGLWQTLPDFDDLRPHTQGIARNIDLSYREQNDAFALVFEGYVKVPTSDIYTFTTLSDDGSKLYINDQLIVDNDGQHAPRRASGQIGLAFGFHKIRVEYFEAAGGEELRVFWANSTDREEEISRNMLFIEKD